MCPNTQHITHPVHPCPPSKSSTMGRQMSELDLETNRRCLPCLIEFSFTWCGGVGRLCVHHLLPVKDEPVGWRDYMMLWAMFCNLTCFTYLNIIMDQVNPFSVIPWWQWSNSSKCTESHCTDSPGIVYGTLQGVALVAKLSRFQSYLWDSSLIHGSSTLQLAGLKGSATYILPSDTRGHLQVLYSPRLVVLLFWWHGISILGRWS